MTTLLKKGNKIICYIVEHTDKIVVCTGKPSDAACISWTYGKDEQEKAVATANEYFKNYTTI